MFRLFIADFSLNFSTLSVTFCLFGLYILLVPLFIGFSTDLIQHYHLGIIWLSIVFSFLPERFYHQDFEDGSLELYFLSSCHIQAIFIAKLFSYWFLKVIGILITLPFLSFVYRFEQSIYFYLSMILGTFLFTLISIIYSSLTITIKSNSWNSLQHLTALPTLLPLILLCTTVDAAEQRFAQILQLSILVGFICLFFSIYLLFVSITFQTILRKSA